jgi:hypothetical protein
VFLLALEELLQREQKLNNYRRSLEIKEEVFDLLAFLPTPVLDVPF